MTDEELAEFLCGIYDDEECFGKFINGIVIQNYDEDRIAKWLKSEAKELGYGRKAMPGMQRV